MSAQPISRLLAIVDDDESLQRSLQDLTESDGLSPICFSSAEEFLDSDARDKVSCLIADIRMPGISGLELQARLKAERRRTPIIFITAHGDAKMRIHAIGEGAAELLPKPFDDAVLLKVIHTAVESGEMTEQTQNGTHGNGENRYATGEDFLKVFDEDLSGLYQLSFLLAGNHQKAEECFVAGIEDCVKANRVFREWARAWAKRMIVENAIRELNPRRQRLNSSALLRTALSRNQQSSDPIGHFDLDHMLGLADFERFVFVLCVLERYRVHECALFLGCSTSEIREACAQAIEELANSRPGASNRYEDRERRAKELEA